jgi:hypothetical protein
MVTRIKKEYLDPRGVGVRRFAELTGIRRTRLNRLFTGQEVATVSELDCINRAVNGIEEQHRKLEDRQKAAAENTGLLFGHYNTVGPVSPKFASGSEFPHPDY